MTAEQIFLSYSTGKLTQYAGRIASCLDRLDDEQIWARSSDANNAIGNLVLHLCGNVRQWIAFGVAGRSDSRDRDSEFSASGGTSRAHLKARLTETVFDAVEIIASLEPGQLTRTTRVQGYTLSVLEAIYHVTEHFSHHTGQIIFATKAISGDDLGFYRHLGQAAHSEKVP
jgi:uncharacterized damage-inducible protein DinB